ncbi:uncharacterized protein N7515_005479 [Penicillium bovifimosum]|uniref:Uncharacterized protein n=1 Tax=Penicillium bovifimosum TaxID=126998 RepID=A0A9W9L064_9EURO|nr:uncharacterized protein N7515_005479 [Penicillium bovifimosum]KAJ5129440.1 hypothetical protein N7515_005479 [Penicillium bovifimosum]
MEPSMTPRLQAILGPVTEPVTELPLDSPLIRLMEPSPDILMDTSPDTPVDPLSPDFLAEDLIDISIEPSMEPLIDLSMELSMEPPMAPLIGPLMDLDIEPPMAPLIGPLIDLDISSSSGSISGVSLESPLISPMNSRLGSPMETDTDYDMTSESSCGSPFLYLPDSLGLFFHLPPEVRLIIWEYLFSTIHTKLFNNGKPNANPLSILSASRYLYTEVSSHLYNNCTENILMKPAYDADEWMRIELEATNMHVDIILKDKAAADRHFQTFPHHRANVIVHLKPPNKDDPGQLVLLWRKSLEMVNIIMETIAPHPFRLTSYGWDASEPPSHWQYTQEDFFNLGGLQETPQSPFGYFPDHDIIILPFIRAQLWFENPSTDMAALTDEQFTNHCNQIRGLFFPAGLERRTEGLFTFTKETGAAAIERRILETNILLENSLDELPGHTASLLRLDRFKHWFEDGQSWESKYQVEYTAQLATNPWLAMHALANSNMRCFTLILTHHWMHCLTYRGAGKRFGVFTKWSSCIWSDKFQLGLPPLSYLFNLVTYRWTAEEQDWIFHNYAEWIAGLPRY